MGSAAKESQHTFDQTLFALTSEDLKSCYKKIPLHLWKDVWTDVTYNKLKCIYAFEKCAHACRSERHIRKEEIILVRLRIGHTLLTRKFLFAKN